MISSEILRRYCFFAELEHQHLEALAAASIETSLEPGEFFFYEGQELDRFYFVIAGEVTLVIGVPDKTQELRFDDQLPGIAGMEDIPVASVGPGEMFGWSALIPPHNATAGARVIKDCTVLEVNCADLEELLAEDHYFARVLTMRAAQTIRERLHCMRIESLTFLQA